jgi:hypothetical protein
MEGSPYFGLVAEAAENAENAENSKDNNIDEG